MIQRILILFIFLVGKLFAVNAQSNNGAISSLPSPWKSKDIGAVTVPGHANFEKKQFTIEGSGQYNDSTNDQFQFVYIPMDSEGELTVRLVPQTNLQLSRMGLMMRESLVANSPQVSLMLNPGKTTQALTPEWRVVELSRGFMGKPLVIKNNGELLEEPVITNEKLIGYYWLRLQRKYNSFYAFTSIDGKSWTSLGFTFVEMKKKFFAGIAVSSGLSKVKITGVFDHVTIPGWTSEE